MSEYLRQIFSLHGRRFYRAEKQAFLEYTAKAFSQFGYNAALQRGSWFGIESWNLILGDLSSAKNVLIAPYDTPAARLFSHVKCLSNKALSGLLALLPVLLYMAMSWVVMFCLNLPLFAGEAIMALLLFLGYRAIPNSHNDNCTNSGIVLLYRLATKKYGHTAFVLVDHRDVLSLGLKNFLASLGDKGKRLVYLDCVGRGDTIAVSVPEGVDLSPIEEKNVQFLRSADPLIRVSACHAAKAGLTISQIMTYKDRGLQDSALDAVLAYVEKLLGHP